MYFNTCCYRPSKLRASLFTRFFLCKNVRKDNYWLYENFLTLCSKFDSITTLEATTNRDTLLHSNDILLKTKCYTRSYTMLHRCVTPTLSKNEPWNSTLSKNEIWNSIFSKNEMWPLSLSKDEMWHSTVSYN